METSMLAEARAAHRDTWYLSDGGHVTAAEVVGCICVDHLTCTECQRILGDSFLSMELAVVRKKQRTAPPVPVPRVDVGLGQGPETAGDGDRAEWFEAAISGMAARLGLAAAVGDRAKEVFRKMEQSRAWPRHRPGWSNERGKGALYAACLSIACRNEGAPRSLRELAQAAPGGSAPVRKEEIARMTAHIRRRLGEATGLGAVTVSSYLSRFGALVRLGDAEAAEAREAARRLDEGVLDVRHNAESLAAAVACMALERARVSRKPARDVATATGVSYDTVCRVCRSLRPHADLLFR